MQKDIIGIKSIFTGRSPAVSGDFFWLVAALLFVTPVFSQDTSRSGNGVFFLETGLAATSLAGLSTVWYDKERSSFHAFNDAGEWLQLDKAGHVLTSYQVLRINSQILQWYGMEEKKAVKRSLFLDLGYLTFIEILDGFSPRYGASFSDFGANAMGVGIYYLQYRTHTADYFTLKYSFKSSGLAAYRPDLLGKTAVERWLKDYNGQTYWFSFSLQKTTGIKAIPDWLNLAIGYGGTGLLGGKSNPAYNESGFSLPLLKREREYFLSLDINTEKLFKKKRALNRAFRVVSFIKIPLPGIRFGNGRAVWQWVSG